MPRKRRITKLRARQVRWDDMGPSEMLHFWCGWRPPQCEIDRSGSPWQSWEDFLGDWQAVRAEALPEWEAKRAEMRAHLRAMIAQRAEAFARADSDSSRSLHTQLLADAERHLAEDERRGLPFAEIVYQRVLAGRHPEDRETEDDDADEGGGVPAAVTDPLRGEVPR